MQSAAAAVNSLPYPCFCGLRFRTGAERRKHEKLVHGPKPAAPPGRQVDQRIEGGSDHAAARPAVPDDADSAAAAPAADSGCPDYGYGSDGDTGDHDRFDDGDDQRDGEGDSYDLMSEEGFEALKKQLQDDSYSLDLEVGSMPQRGGRSLHTTASAPHVLALPLCGEVWTTS